MAAPPILFFDGLCGLCNGAVDVLLRLDRRAQLRFAPLQGVTAATLLPGGQALPDSVVLLDRDGLHLRSEAILRALIHLGGSWRAAALGRIVPRGIRDALYDAIASRRRRWFGRRATCRIPTSEEAPRFLP
jgi:predicted DCC family thiol-disulfide oxidoreductase YuxK